MRHPRSQLRHQELTTGSWTIETLAHVCRMGGKLKPLRHRQVNLAAVAEAPTATEEGFDAYLAALPDPCIWKVPPWRFLLPYTLMRPVRHACSHQLCQKLPLPRLSALE